MHLTPDEHRYLFNLLMKDGEQCAEEIKQYKPDYDYFNLQGHKLRRTQEMNQALLERFEGYHGCEREVAK